MVTGGARVLIVVLGLMFLYIVGGGAYSAVNDGLAHVVLKHYKVDSYPAFTKIDNDFRANIKPGARIYTPLDTDGNWRMNLIEISLLHRTYLVTDVTDADWVVWVAVSNGGVRVEDVRLEIRPA
jgi:hypothetical protein